MNIMDDNAKSAIHAMFGTLQSTASEAVDASNKAKNKTAKAKSDLDNVKAYNSNSATQAALYDTSTQNKFYEMDDLGLGDIVQKTVFNAIENLDNSTSQEAAEAKGREIIEAIYEAFGDGMSQEDASTLLSSLDSASQKLAEETYSTTQERINAIVEQINLLIQNNPAIASLNGEIKEALFMALFGVEGVSFNGSGLASEITNNLTQVLSDTAKEVQSAFGGSTGGGPNNQDNSIVNQYLQMMGDYDENQIREISARMVELAQQGITDIKQAYSQATNEEDSLVNINSANNISDLVSAKDSALSQGFDEDFNETAITNYTQKLVELQNQLEVNTGSAQKYAEMISEAARAEAEAAAQAAASKAAREAGAAGGGPDEKAAAYQQRYDAEMQAYEADVKLAEMDAVLDTRAKELADANKDLNFDSIRAQAKDLAKSYTDLGYAEGEAGRAAAEYAAKQQRYSKGIDDAKKSLAGYAKELRNSTKGTADYTKAAEGTKEILADILNTSKENISSSFLDKLAADGDLLERVAAGDLDAIEQVQKAAAEEVLLGIKVDSEEGKQKIQEALDILQDADLSDIEVGMSIDDVEALNEFQDVMNQMLASGEMTADQVSAALEKIGFEPEITEEEYTLSDQDKASLAQHGQVTIEIPKVSPDGDVTKVPVTLTTEQIGNMSTDGGTTIKIPRINGKGTKATGGVGSKANAGGGGGGGKGKGGGGGKGGGQAKEPKTQKKKTDKVDKLHNANRRLDDLSKSYDKLSNQQEHLFGKNLINNLNKQLDLLEKQRDVQKEKLQIAKEEYEDRRKDLQKLADEQGIKLEFDENGELTNYTEA